MKALNLLSVLTSLILGACTGIPNNNSASDAAGVNSNKRVEKAPPNIVIILSDDHAWNDYGFMGSPHVNTPTLDKLAAQGVTFKRGYVPTALCRPSLATIATGLYASQHKISGNDPANTYGKKNSPKHNAAREKVIANIDNIDTLPQMLREKGYVSMQTGKWWEGSYQRGGFDQGMTRGFPHEGGRHGDDGLKIGRQGMDIVTEFIDQATVDKKPFFLWYAPYLPHAPHKPPLRLLKKYQDKYPLPLAKYYAMIEWFDETNGQLLDHIEKSGVKDNTLVIYVSDNGWIQDPRKKDRFLARSKRSPFEAGVRTPIIYSLPTMFKPKMRSEMTSSIDIVPTVLGAAGLTVPEHLPGLNLFETFKQQAPITRNTLFGESFGHDIVDIDNPEASLLYRWVIEDDWKLILSYDGANTNRKHKQSMRGAPRLYSLTQDPFETINLADKYPDIVERLSKKLLEWYPLNERKMLTKTP